MELSIKTNYCVSCGYRGKMVYLEYAMVCPICDHSQSKPLNAGPLYPNVVWFGIAVGMQPFFFSLAETTTTTSNGQTITEYFDVVGAAGGGLAYLAGAAAVVFAMHSDKKMPAIAVGAGVLALGLYQLLHGLGIA
jgi:NAD-dependent SIR2 family protein deacetylase